MVNHLQATYATDHLIAVFVSDIHLLTKRRNGTANDYSDALCTEMLVSEQVYNEPQLKGLIFKGLQPSIRHRIRAD